MFSSFKKSTEFLASELATPKNPSPFTFEGESIEKVSWDLFSLSSRVRFGLAFVCSNKWIVFFSVKNSDSSEFSRVV